MSDKKFLHLIFVLLKKPFTSIPFLGLIAICAIVSFISPLFITWYNFLSVARQASINALIAYGMTIVIISGGIDLSVGSTLAFSSMVMALCIAAGIPISLAVLIALVVGAIAGLLNGILISKGKLQPFIATLGSMMIFRGVTLYISDGVPVSRLGDGLLGWIGRGYAFSIPIPIYMIVFCLLVFSFFMNKTTFGKRIYAIGGNEKAARLSGVDVERNLVYIYVISGVMASLAGITLTSRIDSAVPTAGITYELNAIAASVIGGVSLQGGKGRISGTIIGALIIAVLLNGLNVIGVSDYLQQIFTGLIIIFAVLADSRKKM